jgi:hypothetical protein
MTSNRAARAAPRERSSPRNGQPETVPYVYRQQRTNTYAARIAQRNAQPAGGRSSDLAAVPDEAVRARVPIAGPDAIGGPSWPGFGELGVPVENQEPEPAPI